MSRRGLSGSRFVVASLMLFPLVLAPARAAAQHFSLSPAIGVYIPTSSLQALSSGQQVKMDVGLTFGGRASLGLGSRVGLMVTGDYVPGKLRYTIANGTATTNDGANLFFGSGRLLVYLLPPTSPVWLQLSGGVGLVKRSGAAYATLTEKTDVGGVAGATLGVRAGPIAVFAGADTYLYTSKGFTTTTGERPRQRDIQLSFGFGVPFGGGR